MKPSDFTKLASRLLDEDRAEQHGNYQVGFARAAQVFGAILNVPVTPHQVALCMAGLKLVRASINPSNDDNHTDLAGYAGIAGALANLERSTGE